MNKTARNILLRTGMLIGLTAFVLLVVMAKVNRDYNTSRHIKISIDEWNGNFFVSKSQVYTFIKNNYDVSGRVLSGKDLEQIEKGIAQIPQVKTANAFTDNKGDLNIKIEQRMPVMRVYNVQGQSYYVDESGMKFPLSNYFAARVPVVTGNIAETCDTTSKIRSIELQRVFNIVGNVNGNKVWKAMAGQYNVNEKGYVELIPRSGNATVLLGDDKDISKKLKKLDIFYFDVLRKVGWNYYRVINIMYKDQVVCLK
jgi:cell division protein FtsQ